MSNCCWTSVELPHSPASVRPANSSSSLPKPQFPTFLPFSDGRLVVLPFGCFDTCNVPGPLEYLGDVGDAGALLA